MSLPYDPPREPSPVEVEVKPSLQIKDEAPIVAVTPSATVSAQTAPLQATRSSPRKLKRVRIKSYDPSDSEVDSEGEEQEAYEEGSESESEDDYVDDSKVSYPSPPPSSPLGSPPPKRRRIGSSTKAATKPVKSAGGSSGGAMKTGAFSPEDDLALFLSRRPLLVKAEWKDTAKSLNRDVKPCQNRYPVIDRKMREMFLSGKFSGKM